MSPSAAPLINADDLAAVASDQRGSPFLALVENGRVIPCSEETARVTAAVDMAPTLISAGGKQFHISQKGAILSMGQEVPLVEVSEVSVPVMTGNSAANSGTRAGSSARTASGATIDTLGEAGAGAGADAAPGQPMQAPALPSTTYGNRLPGDVTAHMPSQVRNARRRPRADSRTAGRDSAGGLSCTQARPTNSAVHSAPQACNAMMAQQQLLQLLPYQAPQSHALPASTLMPPQPPPSYQSSQQTFHPFAAPPLGSMSHPPSSPLVTNNPTRPPPFLFPPVSTTLRRHLAYTQPLHTPNIASTSPATLSASAPSPPATSTASDGRVGTQSINQSTSAASDWRVGTQSPPDPSPLPPYPSCASISMPHDAYTQPPNSGCGGGVGSGGLDGGLMAHATPHHANHAAISTHPPICGHPTLSAGLPSSLPPGTFLPISPISTPPQLVSGQLTSGQHTAASKQQQMAMLPLYTQPHQVASILSHSPGCLTATAQALSSHLSACYQLPQAEHAPTCATSSGRRQPNTLTNGSPMHPADLLTESRTVQLPSATCTTTSVATSVTATAAAAATAATAASAASAAATVTPTAPTRLNSASKGVASAVLHNDALEQKNAQASGLASTVVWDAYRTGRTTYYMEAGDPNPVLLRRPGEAHGHAASAAAITAAIAAATPASTAPPFSSSCGAPLAPSSLPACSVALSAQSASCSGEGTCSLEGGAMAGSVAIGIVCMTKKPLEMHVWLEYHRRYVGVRRFFIKAEDTPELAPLFASPPWNRLVVPTFDDGTQRDYFAQMDRQSAHIAATVPRARAAGLTHLLHIDDDELLYCSHGAAAFYKLLAAAPADRPDCHLSNIEALMPSDACSSPFRDANTFRHFPTQYVSYTNGKSLARLDEQTVRAHGPHHFRTEAAAGGANSPVTFSIPPDFGVVLHYESATFAKWSQK